MRRYNFKLLNEEDALFKSNSLNLIKLLDAEFIGMYTLLERMTAQEEDNIQNSGSKE